MRIYAQGSSGLMHWAPYWLGGGGAVAALSTAAVWMLSSRSVKPAGSESSAGSETGGAKAEWWSRHAGSSTLAPASDERASSSATDRRHVMRVRSDKVYKATVSAKERIAQAAGEASTRKWAVFTPFQYVAVAHPGEASSALPGASPASRSYEISIGLGEVPISVGEGAGTSVSPGLGVQYLIVSGVLGVSAAPADDGGSAHSDLEVAGVSEIKFAAHGSSEAVNFEAATAAGLDDGVADVNGGSLIPAAAVILVLLSFRGRRPVPVGVVNGAPVCGSRELRRRRRFVPAHVPEGPFPMRSTA